MKKLLLLIVLLALCIPAFAQDATSDAVAPVATVESAPVTVIDGQGDTVINVEAPDTTPAPVSNSVEINPVLQLILGACALLVAISFAFEKLGNRAKKATDNAFEMAALEKAGDSVPGPIASQIAGALERTTAALQNVTEAWKKATDHIPESSKPVMATSTVSGTTPNYASTMTPTNITGGHGDPASGDAFRG
jgi:hypothetical protein